MLGMVSDDGLREIVGVTEATVTVILATEVKPFFVAVTVQLCGPAVGVCAKVRFNPEIAQNPEPLLLGAVNANVPPVKEEPSDIATFIADIGVPTAVDIGIVGAEGENDSVGPGKPVEVTAMTILLLTVVPDFVALTVQV